VGFDSPLGYKEASPNLLLKERERDEKKWLGAE